MIDAVAPEYPVVVFSSEQTKCRRLYPCSNAQVGHVFPLRDVLRKALDGALLLDSEGRSFHLGTPKIVGLHWRWYFETGPAVGVIVFLVQIVTLGVTVRVEYELIPSERIELKGFKKFVLGRIENNYRNFMGRGGVVQWRAPINTSTSVAQVIRRLCLLTDAVEPER